MTFEDVHGVARKLHMQSRQGKHTIYWLEHEGKKVLTTVVSHGRGDVGRVESAIRSQLCVNRKQMADLVNCPMTRKAYIDHLVSRGVIPPLAN